MSDLLSAQIATSPEAETSTKNLPVGKNAALIVDEGSAISVQFPTGGDPVVRAVVKRSRPPDFL